MVICALGYQTSAHKIIRKGFMVQVVNSGICKMLTQVSQHGKLDRSGENLPLFIFQSSIQRDYKALTSTETLEEGTGVYWEMYAPCIAAAVGIYWNEIHQ